jgi:hypothetical protein
MTRRTVAWSVAAAVLAGVGAWGSRVIGADGRPDTPPAGGTPVPVVVELFTSEGCSSCPPADTLLTRLAAERRIGDAELVTLAFHVDYWDRLGWRDRFSSAAFTERQNRYAAAWNTDRIYTPQAVVDGRREFVGTDVKRALAAFTEAAARPHLTVWLARAPDDRPARRTLRVAIDPPAGGSPGATTGDAVAGGALTGDGLLAVAEDGLSSAVTAGENAHKRLEHTGVVRSLTRIGRLGKGGTLRLDSVKVPIDAAWASGRLRAVVFVQDDQTREIRGAGQLAL